MRRWSKVRNFIEKFPIHWQPRSTILLSEKDNKKNRLWVFKIILWQWPCGLEAWKSDNVDRNIWILLSSTHSSSVLILQGSKVLIFGTYYTIYGWSLKLFTRKWKEMKKTDFKTNSDELLQTWLKLLYRICCHDGLLYKLWSIAVVACSLEEAPSGLFSYNAWLIFDLYRPGAYSH